MNIFSPQYSKYSFLDVAQQILANLEIVQKSIMKTQKSLTEVNSANIGFMRLDILNVDIVKKIIEQKCAVFAVSVGPYANRT